VMDPKNHIHEHFENLYRRSGHCVNHIIIICPANC